MGLAGEKKRSKLSQDPNNTAWSKSTDGFGHKILSQQGWKAGDYLGAQNASHAEHYTAANASHIKVMLREDNLGLGAKIGGAANAESFGLSTLAGIFGRLNGKTEAEVEQKQSGLRDAELRTYQAQKYGHMSFVRGGLLVGDKIEEFPAHSLAATTVDTTSASAIPEESSSKKRKSGSDGDSDKREGKKLKASTDGSDSDDTEDSNTAEAAAPAIDEKAAKRARKEQKKADRESRSAEKAANKGEKARLKQEKRARKEERRKRREEKKAAKTVKSGIQDVASSNAGTPLTSEAPSGTSTPSSIVFAGSRHAVRQRYIMQKRAASMDPKALNEILMIKAQG